MRLRDRTTTPWVVQTTELFEAAFFRRLAPRGYEAAIELLDLFERQALIDPRMPGVEHPALPGVWLYEGPAAIVRLPRIVVAYAIDDRRGVVDLWNIWPL